MRVTIRLLQPSDLSGLDRLARICFGDQAARELDPPEACLKFLRRNPGTSFVALLGELVIGLILAGHDGRRGFIHQLMVEPVHRRQGVGRALVEQALTALRLEGITRVHVVFRRRHVDGVPFWKRLGCQERLDTVHISLRLASDS